MRTLTKIFRQLIKAPVSNGVIVLTIALLVGGLSVIYASIRHQQRQLLPFPGSEKLVKFWRISHQRAIDLFPGSVYLEYFRKLESFAELAAVGTNERLTLTGTGEPVSCNSQRVTPNFAQVTEIAPLIGRWFTADEAKSGQERTVLISEQLWRDRFGGDPAVLGRSIQLNAEAYTVIGVLPGSVRTTRLGSLIDLWLPQHVSEERTAVRALLAEISVLGFLGGGLGLITSAWMSSALRLRYAEAQLDWQIFLFGLAGALLVTVLAGSVPAVRSSRTDLNTVLKQDGRTAGGSFRHRLRNLLVSSQVAMAMVLCIVAGLMTKTFVAFYAEDLGFDPERMVAVEVDLRRDTYPKRADWLVYVDQGLRALQELPGIEQAALEAGPAFSGWRMKANVRMDPDGQEQPVESGITYVHPDYFSVLGIPLIRGRLPKEGGPAETEEIIVNQSFADQFLATTDPIGTKIYVSGAERWLTIAGIVQDRPNILSYFEVGPELFLSHRLAEVQSLTFLATTRSKASAMEESIRNILQRVDANQPVQRAEVVANLLQQRVSGPKHAMLLLSSFGAVGLFIALIGLYGVVANTVMERTREIGVRMAVGADRGRVLRLVIWQGARLILIGIVPGLLVGVAVTVAFPFPEFVDSGAMDPTYLLVALAVMAAGLVACYFPARKVTQLHPMQALRQE